MKVYIESIYDNNFYKAHHEHIFNSAAFINLEDEQWAVTPYLANVLDIIYEDLFNFISTDEILIKNPELLISVYKLIIYGVITFLPMLEDNKLVIYNKNYNILFYFNSDNRNLFENDIININLRELFKINVKYINNDSEEGYINFKKKLLNILDNISVIDKYLWISEE